LYGIEFPEHLLTPKHFEIWPEHQDVLLMFLRCQTQWRCGPNGLIGLDYGVVIQLCDLYHVGDKAQLMDDLQIMEGHALELIAEKTERQQKQAERKANRGKK
jgi:hypothetical protein